MLGYRGFEIQSRLGNVCAVRYHGVQIKLLKPAEGETMQSTAKAYIDYLIHSDEVDRQLTAKQENYEEITQSEWDEYDR